MEKDLVTVNNFFGYWLTDIDIRRYADDMRIYQQIIALIFIHILMLH